MNIFDFVNFDLLFFALYLSVDV